ncbi:MAG: T9SS type A sorting domain-containing protein [Flavipsychrobacter sp.]|nr:T9SS type A sorting domain-containing protein [Flavipsychrobacter sp.]
MKATKFLLSLTTAAALFSGQLRAQNGHVYTAISSSVAGFSGDGGHASQASTNYIYGIARDNAGNIYIGDENNYRIRRIDAVTGIITTIAGNGTQGYSGDGGPAVNAEISGSFIGMCFDANDNLYFYDPVHYVIRKIDGSTGIITTYAGTGNNYDAGNGGLAANASIGAPVQGLAVANNKLLILTNCRLRKVDLATDTITHVTGNGSSGYTGDGGLATSATIGYSFGVTGDAQGNVYIADNSNHVIRKVDAGTGIITTICGTGQANFAVDGVPAVTAALNQPFDIDFDRDGNLLIADFGNGRIRRINMTTGIINNIAGMGTYQGSTTQAHPALTARVDPRYLCTDNFNNIYFTESANAVEKLSAQAPQVNIASDSFFINVFHQCGHTEFVAVMPGMTNPNFSIKTFYGDGQDDTRPFVQRFGENSGVFEHSYAISGSYPVKHVLYNSSNNAIDSIQYNLAYSLCRSISANLFLDGNSDCTFDANTESPLAQPSLVAVDSNNVAVDTISVTGRFIYNSFGNVGDVYKFTVIDLPVGLQASCLGGIFTDTIQTGIYTGSHDMGVACGTGSAFDLSVNGFFAGTGISADADIIVQNSYCNAQTATVSMTFSPKYQYVSAFPAPTSQVGNVVTWTLAPGDFSDYMAHLHVSFINANSQIVMPGDTVHTTFTVSPTTGDIDPANNTVVRVDTVTGPYDPNAVYVSPEGCITPGTNLEYTVTFENMGNDTAHNIYVLDTLNSHVDLASLQFVTSSHPVSMTKLSSNGLNIIRFDFVGINLPDSSHHDLCHGRVVYTINSSSIMGLSDVVENKAGIYFDYMPAVLTNVAQSEICQPQFVSSVKVGGSVSLYPNPANNELTIRGDKSVTSCTVLNQAGQVLLRRDVKDGSATLNVKHLPAGMYFVNVVGASGSEVLKFIKL